MTMVSSGPISLAGTATSGGLNQSIEVELGGNGSTQISLNDSSVRTLLGVASGTISLSDAYGKANTFSFTISSDTTNVNLRSAAIAAGWNGSAILYATINSGVTVYSTSTSSAALIVSGSFPGGVYLTNNGTILGAGGSGGGGGYGGSYPYPGSPGSAGGLGMSVSSTISITNNGRIAGGGGGGAGGQGEAESTEGGVIYYYGGGGGGGIGNGVGAYPNGTNGTLTANGTGGAPPIVVGQAEYGGNGGSYGAAGGNRSGASGGAGGGCLTGNSYITWLATGTRNGTIS